MGKNEVTSSFCRDCIYAIVKRESETEKDTIAKSEIIRVPLTCSYIYKEGAGWHVRFYSQQALRAVYIVTNNEKSSGALFQQVGAHYESSSIYFGDMRTFKHKNEVFVVLR